MKRNPASHWLSMVQQFRPVGFVGAGAALVLVAPAEDDALRDAALVVPAPGADGRVAVLPPVEATAADVVANVVRAERGLRVAGDARDVVRPVMLFPVKLLLGRLGRHIRRRCGGAGRPPPRGAGSRPARSRRAAPLCRRT